MEFARAQASLQAAEICLAHGLVDSAVNRAYFALFQAAICALERRGMRRREWTHKGVHSDFVHSFLEETCPCQLCRGLAEPDAPPPYRRLPTTRREPSPSRAGCATRPGICHSPTT